ncbi:ArsR family transcriptional regulator [Promethearchaeum syntrophicum]|uniref:ArsR family transcriptional regulator n=1 Tax=Promethearchaeum syntrophicum TaxID=2594042 RepID=A0A5B9DCC0_9ARCH|nr:winged helix-turn-helix domain-containing protein [Candidatus Prometheoarchaeum syntrophicum]QEE16772.1 hypothetical protein DSAG12_02602 [Candidatus Prometheoarchaeum syntrophicum]
MTSKNPNSDSISAEIILKSAPKFQIYSMLLIHPELNLNQLSGLLNKAKSTVHEHLDALIDCGLVSVIRKEKIRSDREKNYYGLTQEIPENQNFEESNLAPIKNTKKEKENYCREVLKVYQSFTIQQISILNNWKKYLDGIEDLIQKRKIDEAYRSLVSVKNPENLDWIRKKKEENEFHNYASLLSVSFFTPEIALEFVESVEKIHNKLQQKEIRRIQLDPSQKRVERTVYGGISVIPIKFVLNFLNQKNNLRN